MRTLPSHKSARASVTHYRVTAAAAAAAPVTVERTLAQHRSLTTLISSRCDSDSRVSILMVGCLGHMLCMEHKKNGTLEVKEMITSYSQSVI